MNKRFILHYTFYIHLIRKLFRCLASMFIYVRYITLVQQSKQHRDHILSAQSSYDDDASSDNK